MHAHRSDVERSDEQGGIGMLRRLCERYGWALEFGYGTARTELLSLRMQAPNAVFPTDAT
jgi:hypothetical protein